MSGFNRRDLFRRCRRRVRGWLMRARVAAARIRGAGGAGRGRQGHLFRGNPERPLPLDGERQGSGVVAVSHGSE